MLQMQPLKPHPYQSVWTQWVGNARAIWYLYENVDGAQRGVLLVGNPFTMLVGLIGAGVVRLGGRGRQAARHAGGGDALPGEPRVLDRSRRSRCSSTTTTSLPSTFLMAALALTLDEFWQRKSRAVPLIVLGIGRAVRVVLPDPERGRAVGPQAFNKWMWYDGWR